MYHQNDGISIPHKFVSIFLCVLTALVILLNIANEYNYANFSKEIRPIVKSAIPVSCIPLEENNGKLVHINCPLQDLETFYVPPEFSNNLYSFQGVFFETKVEMYQWVRNRNTLGLVIQAKFVDHVVPTPYSFMVSFKNRKNPTYIPHINTLGRKYANYVKVGNYRIPKDSLINFQRKKKLDLVDDGWFTESAVKPPFVINHQNTKVYDNYLYTGDPTKPQIGDIRISFYGNTATHATVVGIQKSRLLNTIFEIEGVSTKNNNNILLVSEDNKNIVDQMNEFIFKNYGNTYSLWVLRILCFFLIAFHVYNMLRSDPRSIYWRFVISILISSIALTLVPCFIWFFCDVSIFLFLLIFVFLLFIALLFIYNTDSENEYVEMKNYKRKSLLEPRNYTFSVINENFEDVPDEYSHARADVNTLFGSESEVSFSHQIKHPNDHQTSSPSYIYQRE